MINWKFALGDFRIFILLGVFTCLTSCLDLDNIGNVDIINTDAEYAIPLINSTLTLETVLKDEIQNTGVSYDENGLAVVRYQADVVKKEAYDVFKPIIFPGPLYFEDSVKILPFDLIDNYVVEKGTIRGDSIRFGFTSNFDEEITVSMFIRQFELNGEGFFQSIKIPANSSIITPLYSIRSFNFESPDNQLTFTYDARKQDGERVILDNTYFEFTYLVFDFVQGFLGKNTQKLKDQKIDVNIFELWESGLLEFENPKIRVRLDNSFGLPVKAVINHFEVTNLEGETITLESEIFNDDILFDYPSLDEIGTIKSSEFIFDKDNSNFGTAFNQKVVQVSYDVDAVANPDNDQSLIGFFTFDSYYLLNVVVELPIIFKAQDFQLADQFPIDSIPVDFDLVDEFELKAIISNLFPVEAFAQLYFMDEQEEILDSLFVDGERFFPAATINPDGSINPGGSVDPIYLNFGEFRKDILKESRRIAARLRFSTKNNEAQWTSITKEQGLDIKIGLKFKFK